MCKYLIQYFIQYDLQPFSKQFIHYFQNHHQLITIHYFAVIPLNIRLKIVTQAGPFLHQSVSLPVYIRFTSGSLPHLKLNVKRSIRFWTENKIQWYNQNKSNHNISLNRAIYQTFFTNYNLKDTEPNFCDKFKVLKISLARA